MAAASRLAAATALAVILSLVLAGAQIMGIAVWKFVLAACGLAIVKYSRSL